MLGYILFTRMQNSSISMAIRCVPLYGSHINARCDDQFVIFWENDELQIDVFLFIRQMFLSIGQKYFSITFFFNAQLLFHSLSISMEWWTNLHIEKMLCPNIENENCAFQASWSVFECCDFSSFIKQNMNYFVCWNVFVFIHQKHPLSELGIFRHSRRSKCQKWVDLCCLGCN